MRFSKQIKIRSTRNITYIKNNVFMFNLYIETSIVDFVFQYIPKCYIYCIFENKSKPNE